MNKSNSFKRSMGVNMFSILVKKTFSKKLQLLPRSLKQKYWSNVLEEASWESYWSVYQADQLAWLMGVCQSNRSEKLTHFY